MKAELEKFQGKWKLLELKKDGIPASTRETEETFIEFTDNRFIETAQGDESFGKITLCPGAAFGKIESVISVNCACEKRLKGIYAFEKDLMKICFSEGGSFPRVLDSLPESECVFKVWRRL